MKTNRFFLPLALMALALMGCVQDKPAPRLDSTDRNERIEAVRHAQTKYGARADPPDNQPSPAAVPAILPAPQGSGDAPVGDGGALVGHWNHLWGDFSFVQFAADGSFKRVALLGTSEGTWRLSSPGTIEVNYPAFFNGRNIVEIKYRLNGDRLELDEGFGWCPFTKAP